MSHAAPSRGGHSADPEIMADPVLSKLRIERGAGDRPPARPRWRWRAGWAAVRPIAATAAVPALRFNAAIPVETAAVTSAYPSQAYTLLNATGYVVAQRKAAVASKATGR